MKKTVYSIFVLAGIISLCLACGGKTNKSDSINDSIDQESVEGLYTMVTDPVTGEVRKELKQMPLEQPAPMKGVPEQILKRKSYITSYNFGNIMI